jgi:predicted Zn-dependent protease
MIPTLAFFNVRIGLVHLLQSRNREAIVWFEKAHSANPGLIDVHAFLASAYALKGDVDRAAAELAEARRLSVRLEIAAVVSTWYSSPPRKR